METGISFDISSDISSDDVVIVQRDRREKPRTRKRVAVKTTNRKRGRPRTKPLPEEHTEPVTKYDEYVGMSLTFKIKSKTYMRRIEKSDNKYYINDIGKGIHILTDKELDDAIKDAQWILMQLK